MLLKIIDTSRAIFISGCRIRLSTVMRLRPGACGARILSEIDGWRYMMFVPPTVESLEKVV